MLLQSCEEMKAYLTFKAINVTKHLKDALGDSDALLIIVLRIMIS